MQFGDKHFILKLLLEDIKSIPLVKSGDFIGFEKLSFRVNNFRDRLIEMGLINEVENSFVLNEIENKLDTPGLHKWLESLNHNVGQRRVGELVIWMDKQTQLRRLMQMTESGSSNTAYNWKHESYRKRDSKYVS